MLFYPILIPGTSGVLEDAQWLNIVVATRCVYIQVIVIVCLSACLPACLPGGRRMKGDARSFVLKRLRVRREVASS